MLGRISAIRSLGSKMALSAVLAGSVVVAACGGSPATGTSGSPCPSTTSLSGAGSTFDAPLFSKMFTEYAGLGCRVQVNYQAVGSGAGITQLLQQTVDFGATDAPMKQVDLDSSKNGPVLHIPITIGAVAISYNLPQLPATTHLKLTGTVIANAFQGNITFWDDAAIKQLNPGVSLPHQAITIVHRSDGSGTTGIFSHYLAAVSPDWSSKVGSGNTLNWPVGVGAKGNAGVASAVKNTVGALGYNELAYVLTNTIQYAQVQSKNGDWVLPSLDSAKTAAANVMDIPADLRFYMVNAPGSGSYPISGYSWVIVYQKQANADKGQAIANTLWWMAHDGQQYATALSYVPLPDNMVQKDEAQIKAMTCGSSACYKG
ncbi:MAG TPA: phosphate ABC transporter substrate-binding protein PstS [Ktedonobacterales bacterium]|nr:phosphate ABC transporter substrate-binding protein PstS [Ktedonobacterales bacterium]